MCVCVCVCVCVRACVCGACIIVSLSVHVFSAYIESVCLLYVHIYTYMIHSSPAASLMKPWCPVIPTKVLKDDGDISQWSA